MIIQFFFYGVLLISNLHSCLYARSPGFEIDPKIDVNLSKLDVALAPETQKDMAGISKDLVHTSEVLQTLGPAFVEGANIFERAVTKISIDPKTFENGTIAVGCIASLGTGLYAVTKSDLQKTGYVCIGGAIALFLFNKHILNASSESKPEPKEESPLTALQK